MTNNVGLKTIFSCLNRDIEFILFNPENNKFYMKGNNFNIIEKNNLNLITEESNLDRASLMKLLNIMDIEKFNNIVFDDDYKREYLEALTKFFEDFKKINISLDDLQKKYEVQNLIYFCHFKINNEIFSPRKNLMFLYKKKNSKNFLVVKNSVDGIICYDLDNGEIIPKYLGLIDFKYIYAYVLSFEEKKAQNRTFNETSYIGEYIFLKRDPIPKLK